MVRLAAASRAYGRSLRLRASSQAHYGVDEDEEWWPGRVLGVHSQGAHTGLLTSTCSTTTASSSSNPNRNLDPNPNPNPNTNPNPNPNQASSSSSSRRGACGCRGPHADAASSSASHRDGSIGVRNVVDFS